MLPPIHDRTKKMGDQKRGSHAFNRTPKILTRKEPVVGITAYRLEYRNEYLSEYLTTSPQSLNRSMKRSNKTSISLSDDELGILDAIANRHEISRSTVIRHFLLYHGMCGGDMPLTTRIIALPERQQDPVVAEIRRRTEDNNPARPQSFRRWVTDKFGEVNPDAVEAGTANLLKDLLHDHDNRRGSMSSMP